MNMEERKCFECEEQLRGRLDKKFCNDSCRNSFNNAKNREKNALIKRTNCELVRFINAFFSLFLALLKLFLQLSLQNFLSNLPRSCSSHSKHLRSSMFIV